MFLDKIGSKKDHFYFCNNKWMADAELNMQYSGHVISVFEVFVFAYCYKYYLNVSKFYQILNMQIMHYLIGYALICIDFQKIALNIRKSHFLFAIFLLVDILDVVFLENGFSISLCICSYIRKYC